MFLLIVWLIHCFWVNEVDAFAVSIQYNFICKASITNSALWTARALPLKLQLWQEKLPFNR